MSLKEQAGHGSPDRPRMSAADVDMDAILGRVAPETSGAEAAMAGSPDLPSVAASPLMAAATQTTGETGGEPAPAELPPAPIPAPPAGEDDARPTGGDASPLSRAGAAEGGKGGDVAGEPPFPPLDQPGDEDVAASGSVAAPLLSPTGASEGGEGGGDVAAEPPPSPSSVQTSAEDANADIAGARATDVFTPAPADNPVIVALKREELYRAPRASGQHAIACPWSAEHDETARGDAIYKEPIDALPFGAFVCPHQHGDRLSIDLLIDHLDVKPDEARCKPVIRVIEGEINRVGAAAEMVLSADGRHFHSGGRIVAVRRDDVTGDLATAALSNQALVKALSKGASWQRYDGRSKKYVRCDPRPNVVNFLMGVQTHEVLRPLAGLARQPYFRDDGTLVTVPGYDPVSKVYADFDPAEFPLPEPDPGAALDALHLLRHQLREFKFGGPGDEAAALSAMLTAAVRVSMPFAPAFNISASASGSGKSYLASTIAPLAGPGLPTALPYPTDEAEASKKLLSLLLTKPAVALFDDMQTDWLPFGTMNRMLTSETMADRLLGGNNTATVGTRCLFMGTGNNVSPVRDLRRRVITIYLSPRTSSPVTIRYEGRPADEVRRNRGRYVAAALTIVRAWRRAGSRRSDVPYIATYGDAWADYCRHPLIWMGLPDPAASLIEQVESDPDSDAIGNLLLEWYHQFGSRAMMVRELLAQANAGVNEAVRELPVTDHRGEVNRDKLGWLLKKNANRVMRGLELRRTPTSQRKAWSVFPVGDEPPPLPPSSPGKRRVATAEERRQPGYVPPGMEDEVF